jgi:hypothetical protein
MLYDEPILYFRGLTVFRDFSDPKTFYYLPPEAPRIARSAEGSETGDYAMRLVLFRPDPAVAPPQGMEDGGGFLNLDTDLHVERGTLDALREELRRRFGIDGNPVPVPFREGAVELVLLGVDRDQPGQPFVRKVAGTTVPSLYGTERAAFSTVLDRHGAAVMQSVIERGGATMALAIYHLTYAGIGPAYNLKITIDYKRVFDHLDLRVNAGLSAGNKSTSFVAKAGFHMLLEELKESRAIKVEEVDPVPGENGRTPTNQETINEIIGNLMGSKWFKPTLTNSGSMTDVSKAAGAAAGATGATTGGTPAPAPGGGGTTPATAAGERPVAKWTEQSKTPTPFPAERGVEAFQPSTSGTRETLTIRGSGATAKAGAQPNALQPVALDGNKLNLDLPEKSKQHVEIKWPATTGPSGDRKPATWTPAPTQGPAEGRGVDFTASTSGSTETLVIRGDGATAKVDGQAATITANRLAVEVAIAGQTRNVEITWPGAQGSDETFYLFFDYDRPVEQNNDIAGYKSRHPSPAEPSPALQGEQPRYLEESRSPTTTKRGPDGLDEWLATLQPGTDLKLDAHSSYEKDDTPAKRTFNDKLSRRRLEVAQSLIAGRFPTPGATAHGHTDSKNESVPTLAGDNAPANSRNGRPQHRVVIIKGKKKGSEQTLITGLLKREPPGQGQGLPESTLTGFLERGGKGDKPKEDPTTLQASFEVNLEMIRQEEHIVAVYELNTRKARTQQVHPQGQLILDAVDRAKYIIEADGAKDFFQKLIVSVSTTAQWKLDGIHSIAVQIRYAPRADGSFQRTGEVSLTPEKETGSWETFVLHELADPSRPVVYDYEYNVIVNYTQDVALGTQQGAITSIGARGADKEGWIRSTQRNLVIHPRDVTPAFTVNIATGIVHYDLLQKVQLVLSYGPYRQNIELSAANPEKRIVVRPEPGIAAVLRTEGTLFYKDGARVTLAPVEWKPQELIVINEPRENILRVQVMLADPMGEYERVEAKLRYEQDNRVVETPYTLRQHAQIEEFAVRLEDPAQRAWTYSATLVKKTGDVDTIAWTPGKNDRVIFGVQAVDVIPLEVAWLVPPPAGNLIAVKIDLLYEDRDNDVRWEKSELIRAGHSGTFRWPIAIKDASKRTYRFRVSEFAQNGTRKESPWQDSDTQMLVLLPSG